MNSVFPTCTARPTAPALKMPLNDRIIARLTKGPATGYELAEICGVARKVVSDRLRQIGTTTIYSIEKGEWFATETGRDRYYKLTRIKTGRWKSKPAFNHPYNKSSDACQINRERARAAAKRRAKWIKAGVYVNEMG